MNTKTLIILSLACCYRSMKHGLLAARKPKLLLFFFLISISISTFAQKDYIRFGVGADFSDAYGLKVEYGKTFFRWLEAGVSLGLTNSLPLKSDNMGIQINPGDVPDMIMGKRENYNMDGKLNASLMINGNVDIVKLFAPQSKHGIKLGVGFGVSYYHRMTNVFNIPSSDKIIAMKHQMDFGADFSFIGMYEYALTQNIAVGVFGEYTNAPEIMLFGINIKRSF